MCSLERIAEIRRTFRPVIENDTPPSRARQWRHKFDILCYIIDWHENHLIDNKRVVDNICSDIGLRQQLLRLS